MPGDVLNLAVTWRAGAALFAVRTSPAAAPERDACGRKEPEERDDFSRSRRTEVYAKARRGRGCNWLTSSSSSSARVVVARAVNFIAGHQNANTMQRFRFCSSRGLGRKLDLLAKSEYIILRRWGCEANFPSRRSLRFYSLLCERVKFPGLVFFFVHNHLLYGGGATVLHFVAAGPCYYTHTHAKGLHAVNNKHISSF